MSSGKISGILQLILVAVILSGAFALTAWLADMRKEAKPSVNVKERELVVTSQMVDPVTYRINFDATGTVQVRSPVALVPRVTGEIVETSENLFPGGVFEKGEILFQIEPDDFIHEIQRLEAEVARAQTLLELEQAQADAAVAEWKTLHPDKQAPPLVARLPQLKEARANLDSAKAQLATAKLNLKRTKFSLPFRGRITQANVELGQFVSAGTSLGNAYAISAIEIEMPLEDEEFGWIRETRDPDITVTASYLGQRREFKAGIKRLGAEYDPQTRLARVVLAPEDVEETLIPGIFVDIEVIGPTRKNVWLLPIDALQEDNTIWRIGDDNTLRIIKPEIIHITPDYVAAYSNGEPVHVVTGPLPEATEGAKVRIRSTERQGDGR